MISDKDMLLGYIGTLPEYKCKDIYLKLISKDDRYIRHYGLVQLTTSQYNRLLFRYGYEKLMWCIEFLNNWFKNKEDGNYLMSYSCLNGWVGDRYDSTYPDKQHETTRYKSEFQKARAYVSSIPVELRVYDRDVRYYINKYGIRLMEGIDDSDKFKETLQRYYAVHGRRYKNPQREQPDGGNGGADRTTV